MGPEPSEQTEQEEIQERVDKGMTDDEANTREKLSHEEAEDEYDADLFKAFYQVRDEDRGKPRYLLTELPRLAYVIDSDDKTHLDNSKCGSSLLDSTLHLLREKLLIRRRYEKDGLDDAQFVDAQEEEEEEEEGRHKIDSVISHLTALKKLGGNALGIERNTSSSNLHSQ